MPRFRSLMLLALALAAGRGVAATPDLVSAFFQDDAIINPQVSPDGTRIAFLTPSQGVDALAMLDLRTGKPALLARAHADIDTFFWKGSDRIVYSGGANTVICLSLRTGRSTELGTFPVFSKLRADPDHILVRHDGIVRVNVDTGARKAAESFENATETGGYLSDQRGDAWVRFAYTRDKTELQCRGPHGVYHSIWSCKPESQWLVLLGFADGPDTLYVSSLDGNREVLHTINVRTRRWSPPLFTVSAGRIDYSFFSADGARLLGVHLLGADETTHWLDPEMKQVQASVDAALPGRRNTIVSASQDEMVDVVLSGQPTAPGAYFILNRRAKSLSALGPQHPQVRPDMLGPAEQVQFKARDGFLLHAILVRPRHAGHRRLPLVLMPSDPVTDTFWAYEYDDVAEFLAARGYAVLLLNERGAWGFGLAYERAGRHQLAGKIPTDLDDAVGWAVKSGYADPKRVALFGNRWSATVALIAATHSPALYRCVINENGLTDLTRLVKQTWNYDTVQRQTFDYWIGFNAAKLAADSPDRAMSRLQASILNIYDNEHLREQIEYELKKAHKPYTTFHELPPADIHTNAEVRLNYYRQIDAFLAQHL